MMITIKPITDQRTLIQHMDEMVAEEIFGDYDVEPNGVVVDYPMGYVVAVLHCYYIDDQNYGGKNDNRNQ